MPEKTIIVTGATGKQGRAFIEALVKSYEESENLSQESGPTDKFRVVGLTRDVTSAAARSLSSLSASPSGVRGIVRLAQADLDDEKSVRKVFQDVAQDNDEGEGGIWGVFVVLAYPGLGSDATGEEKQGKLLVDLSVEFKVQHFIYSSVERGGEVYDDHWKLDREAKINIEKYIQTKGGSALKWTILRPGFFMDNFDGTIGKVAFTVLRCGLKEETKVLLIAADDIGHVALSVFKNSEQNASKIIVVAGDALTTKEMNEAYTRATGQSIPSVPNLFGKCLIAMNRHTKDLTTDFNRIHENRSKLPESTDDIIKACRDVYPQLMTFEDWARNKGRKDERPEGWNKVSILELLQGKR